MKHETSEGEEVISGDGFGQALVVAGKSAEPRCPSETAFDHASTRQQDKAAFCLSMLDHFQLDAMRARRLFRIFSGVALIHIGQLHAVVRNLLHRLCQQA